MINDVMRDWDDSHFELLEQYLAVDGLHEKHVFPLMGVKENTFYFWKKKAKDLVKALESGKIEMYDLSEGQKKLLKLLDICERGRSRAIAKHLKYIQDAGSDPNHWQASAWYLERIDRESFGRTQDVNLKGVVAVHEIELSEEEEEQFKANLGSFFK